MSLIVMSPSNLMTFRTCPLKFYLQRTGILKWKDSPQKARGTLIHEALQKAVENRTTNVELDDPKVQVAYVQDTLRTITALPEEMSVLTEHEMCVTKEFKPTGWWDNDAFMRCKADLLCVAPGKMAIIGDWKTGRMYDGADFQLRFESLLVYALFQTPVISWMLFYVDQGRTKQGMVNFTHGYGQVQDVIDAANLCTKTVGQGGPFPEQKNPFCRWCDAYRTSHCSASRGW